eukprot:1678028-Rhodomonas_salina.2
MMMMMMVMVMMMMMMMMMMMRMMMAMMMMRRRRGVVVVVVMGRMIMMMVVVGRRDAGDRDDGHDSDQRWCGVDVPRRDACCAHRGLLRAATPGTSTDVTSGTLLLESGAVPRGRGGGLHVLFPLGRDPAEHAAADGES